jgi:AAA domain
MPRNNAIRADRIDVMTIDPFVSSHSVSENNNTYIDRIAKIWCEIADKGKCAVEWIHHVRKPAYGSQEFTVDDGRGASALLAASRAAEVLNPMSKDEAAGFGISEAERRAYFRCDNGKSSMAPPPRKASWFKFESVDLENGNDVRESDSVGVVTAWIPPEPLDGVHGKHVEEIRRRCAVGAFREDFRSPAWVGYMVADVLGLNGNDPAVKKRVKGMLATWLRNCTLKVEERPDGQHKLKRFVLPGDDSAPLGAPVSPPVTE